MAFFVSISESFIFSSIMDNGELLLNVLNFSGDMYVFSFLVVDKLKEMLEETENAVNTFKDEQRQMYVYACFSYKNAFLTQ